jgi:PKD repeat protein
MKRWQANGRLKITPDSISRLAVWDPRIFEKKLKLKSQPNEDIDTRLKDISIAIDVSGSMWSITWNWQNWTKCDNAYLSVVLLYTVAKALNINFNNVVLFSDSIATLTPEEALKKIEHIWWWSNWANTAWIKKAIKSIQNTEKWVVFVISDGDAATWTRFFDDESRKMLLQNKNLFVVWYGIWEDAISKLKDKIKWWKFTTVIEYRMQEAKNEQSKWFNVKEYSNLIEQFKKHLEQFMTASLIKL